MFGCLVVLVWTVFFFRFVKLVKFKPNSVFFGGVRVRVENEEKRNCHISETTALWEFDSKFYFQDVFFLTSQKAEVHSHEGSMNKMEPDIWTTLECMCVCVCVCL